MHRILLAITLILLEVPQARAAPPHALHAPSSPTLAKARALIDRLARDLEHMTLEVERAGTDQDRIRAIGEKFRKSAEAMKTEGEALRKKLTEAENRELETYAKTKIAPLTGRLLAAMMKAQMAPQPSSEEQPSTPEVKPSESSVLVTARDRMAALTAQLRKLTAEARATTEAPRLHDIEVRMRGLWAQGHDDEHAAYSKLTDAERTELRQYRTLQVEPALRRLRRVLDRAGQPECVDLLKARALVEDYARDLQNVQARLQKAGAASEREAIGKTFEQLQAHRTGQLDDVKDLLTPDEIEEANDALDEKVEPLRAALEAQLTTAAAESEAN